MKLWETFADNGTDAQKDAQYAKGYEFGHRAKKVAIAINDTWGAYMSDGSHVTSYEKVGYHAASAWFINGVLDAHCPVEVARIDETGKIVWKKLTKN